jgi:hypothetical protein
MRNLAKTEWTTLPPLYADNNIKTDFNRFEQYYSITGSIQYQSLKFNIYTEGLKPDLIQMN